MGYQGRITVSTVVFAHVHARQEAGHVDGDLGAAGKLKLSEDGLCGGHVRGLDQDGHGV